MRMNPRNHQGRVFHGVMAAILLAIVAASCGGGTSAGPCDPGFHQNEAGECVPDETCQPDSCSGHGTCDDAGGEVVCSCEVGYTGSNCQYCASGYRDDGAGNCVPYDSKCDANSCSGHGTCDDATGEVVCTCDPGYTGATCDQCAAGYQTDGQGGCVPETSCSANSCSGHGRCDDSAGFVVCICDEGYTGLHCESCAPGYRDDGRGNCVAESQCRQDTCNGHGTCSDATGVAVCTCHTGWGGNFCDRCAAGYHPDGDDCVIDGQCLPNTCNQHGMCDDASGVPVCTCEQNYTGMHCEQCAPGTHMDPNGRCLPDEQCRPSSCSGHGTCDDASGVIECTCDIGYGGHDCSVCDAGYHDDGQGGCAPDEHCDQASCSGHGSCSDAGGVIQCSCDPGWSGLRCERCAAGYHDEGGQCVPDSQCLPNSCNGHGECDDAGGQVHCICDTGYMGDHCDVCTPGYHDDGSGTDTCVPDEHCQAGSCSFHGQCDDAGGVVVCACDPGYTGAACDQCAPGYHPDNGGQCLADEFCQPHTCNDRGTCSDAGGVVVCTCDPGYGGSRCERCAAGHHYEDGRCVGDTACLETSCNGHGTCSVVGGQVVCDCDPGWAGDHCDQCAPGYHMDPDGNCVETEFCDPDACGPHGQCDDSSGVIVCHCEPGWGGEDCDECAPGYHPEGGGCVEDQSCGPNSCNQHGVCSEEGGQVVCTCNEGYVGAHCELCAPGYRDDGAGNCVPESEIFCQNTIDDDIDGDTDCDDRDCLGEPGCPDCWPEQTLGCGSIVFGTNIGHDNNMTLYPCSSWLELGPEVAYKLEVDHIADVRVALIDVLLDLDIFILEDACDAATCIAAGDGVVDFVGDPNKTYYVVVDGYLGSMSVFALEVTCDSDEVETDCDNWLDDDNDLLFDCMDPDCEDDPHCQECEATGSIGCNQTVSGTTVGAARGITNYSCRPWDQTGGEMVYTFTAEREQHVDLALTGTQTDLDIMVLDGECQGDKCIAFGDMEAFFTAASGVTYFIAVDGHAEDEGPFTLEVACATAGDEICNDEQDNDNDGLTDCRDDDCKDDPACVDCTAVGQVQCGQMVSGSNAGRPNNISHYPDCNDFDESGGEIAYEFHADTTVQLNAILSNMDADLDIFALEGSCNADTCVETGQNELWFTAYEGRTYFIVVDGYQGAQSSFDLQVNCE